MWMCANIHGYRDELYVVQCSQKDLEGQEYSIDGKVMYSYQLNPPFWSTSYDGS